MCRVTHEETKAEGDRSECALCAPERRQKPTIKWKRIKYVSKRKHWIHLGISNRTMTMSSRMTAAMTTRANQVSYYRRVFSLPSISQQSKRERGNSNTYKEQETGTLNAWEKHGSTKVVNLIQSSLRYQRYAFSSRVWDPTTKKSLWVSYALCSVDQSIEASCGRRSSVCGI